MRSLLLALLLCLPAAAQTCTPAATRQAAAQTLSLQQRLLGEQVADNDTGLPPRVVPLMHEYKQALIAAVDTALVCNNPEPAQVEPGLAALLNANRPAPPATPYDPKGAQFSTGVYGASLTVAARPITGQPGIVFVQLSYGIECGADNILLLYRRTPVGYRRELVWQNPDLHSIGDALGDVFLFTFVPAPVPAVAIIYGEPWCSSNESVLRLDLVALPTPGSPQHRLDHAEHDYRRDWDVRLGKRADGLDLHLTSDSVSGDLVFRPTVLRYTTTSGQLVQQPAAMNAQAFVDQWLTVPWATAARWSDPPAQTRLKAMRDELKEGTVLFAFGPTLACDGHFQVELDLGMDHMGPDRALVDLPNRYAQVRANADLFMLLDLGYKSDPTCHGPDLMKQKK